MDNAKTFNRHSFKTEAAADAYVSVRSAFEILETRPPESDGRVFSWQAAASGNNVGLIGWYANAREKRVQVPHIIVTLSSDTPEYSCNVLTGTETIRKGTAAKEGSAAWMNDILRRTGGILVKGDSVQVSCATPAETAQAIETFVQTYMQAKRLPGAAPPAFVSH